MEIVDIQEHINCFNYDCTNKPRIEIISIEAGHNREVEIIENEIAFFIEGHIRFSYQDYFGREISAGQFMFLPCGGKTIMTAVEASVVIFFRMVHTIRLCENYTIEQLFFAEGVPSVLHTTNSLSGTLPIDEDIQWFLEGLRYQIGRGVKCIRFFDLKITEFLLLLRINYTKKQVREFFSMILSPDTAFSEQVRRDWDKYPSVEKLASSMNMSVKQFSSKFKAVFKQTAYKWMKRSRAELIHREIKTDAKPFKQIAQEYGFNTVYQFTNFCKKELGCTPSEIRRG